MEPFCNTPGTVKGIEVLHFEDAEVSKSKGTYISFATLGPLSVLYFPCYHRFVLQINDWRYPILRRYPIASPDDGSYLLSGPNGFSYNLTINSKSEQSIKNLESLFHDIRSLEASPNDKIMRAPLQKKEMSTKELITETIKHAAHNVKTKVATYKTGTKNLTSTKKMVNLKDIKNKDFKKDAHSKLKKNFFASSEKLSKEFLNKRKDNVNMREPRNAESLQKSHGPVMYIPKESLEESILLIKDRLAPSSPIVDATLGKVELKKGLIAHLRDGIQGMKNSLSRERNTAAGLETKEATIASEVLGHYQG